MIVGASYMMPLQGKLCVYRGMLYNTPNIKGEYL